MRVKLNLARDPFKNHNVWLLGLALLVSTSGVVSISFFREAKIVGRQLEVLAGILAEQEVETKSLRQRIPPPVSPDQLSVNEREALKMAGFIIERRVFPWSKLLEEIETTLGSNARVTAVSVSLEETSRVDVLKPGQAPVKISLTVVGKDLSDVLEFTDRLQKTGRFSAFTPRKQSSVEATNEVEYEWEVTYSPTFGRGPEGTGG